MEKTKKEDLVLDDTVKQNKKGEAILGRLQGPVADFINPTRNGRKYDEELWKKVFNDPIIREYFECGGIPGELDHPTDRDETCSEKIAIIMPEPPKEDDQGHLVASFDILDTPNGRIAYTLAKYGYKLGISSRGNGDTYPGTDGNEHVDEDSYDFKAFDLVLLPAVKDARMKLVTESLQNKQAGFKHAICEALEKANPNGRRIMQETLNNLKIDYAEKQVDNTVGKKEQTAVNDGVSIMKDLQEALKDKKSLEMKVARLQEKLSVCYAKEVEYTELNEKYKTAMTLLTESRQSSLSLRKRVETLTEKVKEQSCDNEKLSKQVQLLKENRVKNLGDKKGLNESLSVEKNKVEVLNKKVAELTESVLTANKRTKAVQEKLNENIENLKKDLAIKNNEYQTKLAKSNEITEKYRKIAKMAVDKYISSNAVKLGVKPEEIKNRLPENYSFNDIDKVCEGLKSYQLNINSLPFELARSNKKVAMKITESKETITPASSSKYDDDIEGLENFV